MVQTWQDLIGALMMIMNVQNGLAAKQSLAYGWDTKQVKMLQMWQGSTLALIGMVIVQYWQPSRAWHAAGVRCEAVKMQM